MKKLFIAFVLLMNYCLRAQENEIGFHLGFGGASAVQMNNGTPVQKPDFFPAPDSLMDLKYNQWGNVMNFPLDIHYIKWRPCPNPLLDQGINFSFGYGGNVTNVEEWQAVDTITYDTIILQSSGEKFPVDSFITDNYSMRTRASAMRFALGYHYRINWSRLDLVFGAEMIFQYYGGKRREYRYYQYGRTNMPSAFQDTTGFEPNFADAKESIERIYLNSFSYGFQFPVELRFHRREDKEERRWFWSPEYMGRVAIRVTPGIYYLRFNGIDKYYGTCSAGLKWYFGF